ncbi:septation ring formation regulator EzrA [Sporolactobacillus sp. CPB3-1]|uniref:Septation ring formation regulator EzrA n=1 Tax=Sporolactobacillus mangiferae TaxID=2940498 RepID=A0ABT0M703_9BACL|nr:septation ring formation regulator EzrA [Sporolactobacillus mangiferae]MCL1630636.1 septation ring formation regulator EzrA [Sporolactobacillus mangiferae]
MLYVLVSLILIVVFVVAYGAWMRKKTFTKIDRAEERRVALMSRPVADELSKIKQLNMAGDTEKKFDKWHKDWDTIVSQSLPGIEETLFQAEELTEKYRFHKADNLVKEMNKKMQTIEKRIEEILSELHIIVESETKNREDVMPLKKLFHQIKKEIITKRSQFGQTLPLLEQSVKTIEEQLKKYESETENGNYLDARQIVLNGRKTADLLDNQIKRVPELYHELKKIIPDQMNELRQGEREMNEQGYQLAHLQINDQLDEAEKHRQLLETAVDHLELDEADAGLKAVHDQLDWLYAQLEKEVVSRNKLEALSPSIEDHLQRVGNKISDLSDETEMIRDSYHIDDEDLKMQRELSRTFQKLEHQFSETKETDREEAFSSVFDKLDHLKEELSEVETLTDEFREKIKTLRKDELSARKQIQKLKRQLFETKRIILKSNLPGVPGSFASALQKASEQLGSVNKKLDEKPLNMAMVQKLLEQAGGDINDVFQQGEKLVDTARFAEEMIQYGNRYRSDYSDIDLELKKAENYFRNYDYQSAAETAVHAVEKKEPKILKRAELYEGREA